MKSLLLAVLVVSTYCCCVTTAAEWRVVRRAEESDTMELLVVFTAYNSEEIVGACQSVSDPKSETYGQYYSRSELNEITAPPASAIRDTVKWLQSHGINTLKVAESKQFVAASATVSQIASAFSLDVSSFAKYSRDEHGYIIRSAKPLNLPGHVAEHIAFVRGVSDFPGELSVTPIKPVGSFSPERPSRTKTNNDAETGEDDSTSSSSSIYTSPSTSTSLDLGNVQIIFPLLSATEGVLLLNVTCNNGMPTTHQGPEACIETGDPLVSVELILTSNTQQTHVISVNASELNVTLGFTSMSIYNIIEYDQYFFTTSGTFLNGFTTAQLPYAGMGPGGLMATPYVTPQMLASFYNYSAAQEVPATKGASQGLVEFEYQYYLPSDLAKFVSYFDINGSYSMETVGLNSPSYYLSLEAELDTQWMISVSPNLPTYFWSVLYNNDTHMGPPNTNYGYMLEWALEMGLADDVPLVSSISYAATEWTLTGEGPGYNYSSDYITRSEVEMAKLCARGLTVVTGAGDAGASDNGHGTSSCTPLAPQYPASSAYITTLSASFIDGNSIPRRGSGLGEDLVSSNDGMLWTTGGGFSGVVPPPWYQTQAISDYFASGVTFPPDSVYNKTGRAYPDLTAIGHNLLIEVEGNLMPIDGTSASTPITAGMFALINNELLAAGKPALGLVNPLLYGLQATNPDAFYDFSQGSNRCATPTCCPFGFKAAPGFDAVSGLGSIYYEEILAAAMAASE